MRTQEDVDEYSRRARTIIVDGCKLCRGLRMDCSCHKKLSESVEAYEACIPRDFWFTKESDIDHNIEVFRKVVLKYVKKIDRALLRGYGLAFLGDNGVGKTFFISYVLMSAIRAGRTAYYTTLPQLDYNLKQGFSDPEVAKRLNWMLTSDFLAIDEMGKEYSKSEKSYLSTQVERILKQRCDDSMPVLIATNMDFEALIELYGETVGSIIGGKFQPVTMKPGDYRRKIAKRMDKEMGY